MYKYSVDLQSVRIIVIVTFTETEICLPYIIKILTTVKSKLIRECDNLGLTLVSIDKFAKFYILIEKGV